MRVSVLVIGAAAALGACSQPSASNEQQGGASAGAEEARVAAPAGRYELDPNHASLVFRVRHMGLSDYTARFTDFDGALVLDPANESASSVTFTVDTGSVDTGFPGDYRATHANSAYRSWDDDLARNPRFFNAAEFPQASFRSTRVERTGPRAARVTGELTLLGQTRPITLDATLTGSTAEYPMAGGGGIGLKATGSFARSDFGMTHLLEPAIVGDEVSIEFNGEFLEVREEPATPAP